MQLTKYEAACAALADAATIDEVKDIVDKAIAFEIYAKQARNFELEANAWTVRKRAEDKLGAMSLALEKAHKVGPGKDVRFPIDGKSKKEVLLGFGISTSTAQRYEQYHLLPDAEKRARIDAGRAEILAGKHDKIAKQKERADRRRQLEFELGQKIAALPTKKYGVIVADPPWSFKVWSAETGMDRSAENHYPTSPLEAIAAQDVPSIAAEDCVLGLWSTVPHLQNALMVMARWGFEYKTNFCWYKDKIGTGFWNRNIHEHFLIGTRGEPPCPAPGEQWDSVITAPRRGHSEKPDMVLEMMETYFPSLPKIELNARVKRLGWDAWGSLEGVKGPSIGKEQSRRAS